MLGALWVREHASEKVLIRCVCDCLFMILRENDEEEKVYTRIYVCSTPALIGREDAAHEVINYDIDDVCYARL